MPPLATNRAQALWFLDLIAELVLLLSIAQLLALFAFAFKPVSI